MRIRTKFKINMILFLFVATFLTMGEVGTYYMDELTALVPVITVP